MRWLLRLIVSLMLVVPVAAKAQPATTKIKSCAVPPGIAATRPDPQGSITRVLVGVYVLDIASINDATQSFTVDFILGLRWKDPRLVDKSLGVSVAHCKLGLGDVWHPAVLFLHHADLSHQWADTVDIDSQGNVTYAQRFHGDLSSPLNLRDFPFDRQVLPITIVSAKYGPEEMVFDVDETTTGMADTLSIADWSIGPWVTKAGYFYFSPQKRFLVRFSYELPATRHVAVYLMKVIAPVMMFIIMSWLVFWLDPTLLAAQVGLSATVMVILVIFHLRLGSLLPLVPYATRMDIFLQLSQILVFLALVKAVTSGALAARGKEALARRLDRWSRWAFPASFVVVLVLAFWL